MMSERSYYVFVCKWRGNIMNKRKRLLAILINGMLLSSLCVASATDVTIGAGNGVANFVIQIIDLLVRTV